MKKFLLVMMGAAMYALPTLAQDAPEALYFVGDLNYWTLPADENYDADRFAAKPDANNPGHYVLVFERQEGETYPVYFGFKLFDSKVNSWEDPATVYGATEFSNGPLFDAVPLKKNIDSDAHSMEVTEQGTKNIIFCNYYGGKFTLDVDWTNKTLTFEAEGQPTANPEALYLIGGTTDWSNTIKIEYNADKKVYEGTFNNVEKGKGEFKIFTEAEVNWENTASYVGALTGPKSLYKPETGITDEALGNASCGNCGMNNFDGGDFTVSVDWENWTYTFTPSENAVPEPSNAIYLIGSPQSPTPWDINSDQMTLTGVGNDVYEGKFYIPEGDQLFRFYRELGNWGANYALPSIGGNGEDGVLTDVTFDNGIYEGGCVYGKGSWKISKWTGGEIAMRVDLANMTVKFDTGESSVRKIETEGSMVVRNGLISTSDNSAITIYSVAGKRLASANGSVSLSSLPKGVYVAVSGGKAIKIVK